MSNDSKSIALFAIIAIIAIVAIVAIVQMNKSVQMSSQTKLGVPSDLIGNAIYGVGPSGKMVIGGSPFQLPDFTVYGSPDMDGGFGIAAGGAGCGSDCRMLR